MIEDTESVNVKFIKKWIDYQATSYIISSLDEYCSIFDASVITSKDKGISYDRRMEVINTLCEVIDRILGFIYVQVKGICVEKII